MPREYVLRLVALTLFIIAVVVVLATDNGLLNSSQANSSNPFTSHTGAPRFGTTSESHCNECHIAGSAGDTLSISGGGAGNTYTPGAVYTMTVSHNASGQWGFQVTSIDTTNFNRAGQQASLDASTNTRCATPTDGIPLNDFPTPCVSAERYYTFHTARNAGNWTFQWTAPATNIGPIRFYASGVKGNGDASSVNDPAYSTTLTLTPAAVTPPDVTVAVAPSSVAEDGATNLVYTFTRTGSTTSALTVNFSVGGSAAFSTDYTQSGAATFGASSGTVTIGAGNSTATVTLDPSADSTVEGNETAVLTVTSGTGYNVGSPSVATGTINNDDTDVSVAVSPSSVAEDGASNLVYTFTRSGVTTGALTVNFSVGGSAAFNTDYTQSGAATFGASSGTVTIAAFSSVATVTLDPSADSTVEPDETVVLTVTAGTGYNVGSPSVATGTINNDDTTVTVAVAPSSVAEDGAGNLVYTFTRSGVTTGALTVNFSVGGGATFNTDYTQSGAATFGASSGTVTIAAFSSVATVTLDPSADSTVESDETAVLTVTAGTGYSVGSPSVATGTITNDDTTVTVAVAPSSVAEDGAPNLVYTFTRSGVTTGALTVNFSVGGGAAFNTDYLQSGAATFGASSGTVTIGAGNGSASVTVDPTTDSTFEPDETVVLTVTAGTGYNVGSPSVATGTITNDDGAPQPGTLQFSAATYSQAENGGTATITVTRTGGSSGAASVQFSNPAGGTATGGASCTAGVDFVTPSGTLNWSDADSASKTFSVTICNDSLVEGDETVNLLLSNATGATLGSQTTAALTINNDDSDVSVAVAPSSVAEDGATNLVYTFTRNGVTTGALTVNFSVGGGATFNTDYTQSGAATFGASSGTVTIGVGNSTANVTLDPSADSTVEGNETAVLTVTSGTGYNVGSPSVATGTINNDDTDVTVAVSPSSVSEDGATNLVYTFTRNGVTTGALTVNFSVGGGATFNTDYTQTGAATFGASSGTVTIGAGNSTATVTVDPSVDSTVEPDETAVLTVTSGTGYNVGSPSVATGTITNDDATPGTLQFSAATYSQGENGGTATITVTRTGGSSGAASVQFSNPAGGTATGGGSCTAGVDYVTPSGTLNWSDADSASKTFNVTICNDGLVEGNETVNLLLSNATGGALGSQTTATLTITEAATQQIQFSQSAYNLPESGGSLVITVNRIGDTSGAATIDYATSDTSGASPCNIVTGAASSRCDYVTNRGTLRFAAGETQKTILIPLVDDVFAEGAETFTITLSNPGGAIIGTPSAAALTINDNDSVNGTSNPIDQASFFVRQHYIDFLNREPDASGLAFWTNEITSCGADLPCIDVKRINVSAAFFLSIEFQQTGYFVERTYKAAYGDATGNSTLGGAHTLPVPIIRLNEFLADKQQIGDGLVVGATGWEALLDSHKSLYAGDFVQRSRFTTAFPVGMTPATFVDTLNANAGNPLSTAERNQLVTELTNGTKTRAQVLRAVVEDGDLEAAEFRRAFVLAQYFGYLRRNPNDLPDTDYTGYDFWLTKLNNFNGNFVNAEMVKAFILSGEYRHRFGP